MKMETVALISFDISHSSGTTDFFVRNIYVKTLSDLMMVLALKYRTLQSDFISYRSSPSWFRNIFSRAVPVVPWGVAPPTNPASLARRLQSTVISVGNPSASSAGREPARTAPTSSVAPVFQPREGDVLGVEFSTRNLRTGENWWSWGWRTSSTSSPGRGSTSSPA